MAKCPSEIQVVNESSYRIRGCCHECVVLVVYLGGGASRRIGMRTSDVVSVGACL